MKQHYISLPQKWRKSLKEHRPPDLCSKLPEQSISRTWGVDRHAVKNMFADNTVGPYSLSQFPSKPPVERVSSWWVPLTFSAQLSLLFSPAEDVHSLEQMVHTQSEGAESHPDGRETPRSGVCPSSSRCQVASLGYNTCAARKYPEPLIHLLKCICTHFQWAAMEKLYPSIKTSKILKQRECKITGKKLSKKHKSPCNS